jgi:hypothetical protein
MDESVAMIAPKPMGLPFEQRIYAHSPLGMLSTTAAVFTVLFGGFLLVAKAEHVVILQPLGSGFALSNAAWPAFVLSLLSCTALIMQRYVRLAEARDAPAYGRILTGGMVSAVEVTRLSPPEARLGRATLIGLAWGLILSVIVRFSESGEGHIVPPMTMIWFGAATTLLTVLFARGVEQTRAGTRAYARTLSAELKIDLLRTDTLAVLGRSAARSALIWFVISAVAFLFFAGGDLNWLTILLIVACAGMGIGMFASIMSRIHRQIVATKATELEHVRCQIDAMRAAMTTNDHAATRLHGLLAYEKRIADAPEWPFDQTTLMRVGASALIVTVPWFGQAIVQYLVEHLGQK